MGTQCFTARTKGLQRDAEVLKFQKKLSQAQKEVAQAKQRQSQAQKEAAQAKQRQSQAQKEKSQAQKEKSQAQKEAAQAKQRLFLAKQRQSQALQRQCQAQKEAAQAKQRQLEISQKLMANQLSQAFINNSFRFQIYSKHFSQYQRKFDQPELARLFKNRYELRPLQWMVQNGLRLYTADDAWAQQLVCYLMAYIRQNKGKSSPKFQALVTNSVFRLSGMFQEPLPRQLIKRFDADIAARFLQTSELYAFKKLFQTKLVKRLVAAYERYLNFYQTNSNNKKNGITNKCRANTKYNRSRKFV